MATNTPSTSTVQRPVVVTTLIPVTLLPSPIILSTLAFKMNSTLPVLDNSVSLLTKAFSALNESLRWIKYTLLHKPAKYKASTKAADPPPTTASSLFLKKKPSQVAQADTPCPLYCSSDSSPK